MIKWVACIGKLLQVQRDFCNACLECQPSRSLNRHAPECRKTNPCMEVFKKRPTAILTFWRWCWDDCLNSCALSDPMLTGFPFLHFFSFHFFISFFLAPQVGKLEEPSLTHTHTHTHSRIARTLLKLNVNKEEIKHLVANQPTNWARFTSISAPLANAYSVEFVFTSQYIYFPTLRHHFCGQLHQTILDDHKWRVSGI